MSRRRAKFKVGDLVRWPVPFANSKPSVGARMYNTAKCIDIRDKFTYADVGLVIDAIPGAVFVFTAHGTGWIDDELLIIVKQ